MIATLNEQHVAGSHQYAAPLDQVAALCTRMGKKGVKVLLVTSSRGRWIIPKGWPMDDCSDAQAARREAWEEAGVEKGSVGQTPVGRYLAHKQCKNGRISRCLVTVYPIAVQSLAETYPESAKRRRRWVKPKHAVKLVEEPGLQDILRAL